MARFPFSHQLPCDVILNKLEKKWIQAVLKKIPEEDEEKMKELELSVDAAEVAFLFLVLCFCSTDNSTDWL